MPANDPQTSSSPSLGEDFRIQASKFRDFVRHSDLFNLLQDISSSKLILDFRTRPEFEASHLPCAQCLSVTSSSTSSSAPPELKGEVVEEEVEEKKPAPKRLFLEDFLLDVEEEEEEVAKKDLFSKLTSVCPQFNHRGFVYKNVILYGGPEHLEAIKLLAVFLLKEKRAKVSVLHSFTSFSRRYPFLPLSSGQRHTSISPNILPPSSSNPIYPSEIVPGKLYLGTYEHATNYQLLANLGITHIVNAAGELEDRFPEGGDFNSTATISSSSFKVKYFRCGFDDVVSQTLVEKLAHCLEFIRNAIVDDDPTKEEESSEELYIKEPPTAGEEGSIVAETTQELQKGGRVLIHCAMGISRSSTVTIAYLMVTRGWSFDEAYLWVRSRRPIINPNSGFVSQLRSYEKTGFPALTSSITSVSVSGVPSRRVSTELEIETVAEAMLEGAQAITETEEAGGVPNDTAVKEAEKMMAKAAVSVVEAAITTNQ